MNTWKVKPVACVKIEKSENVTKILQNVKTVTTKEE